MKVAVSGAAGRMGKRILALAHEHPEIEVVGAVEAPSHPAIGNDAGEVAGIGRIGMPIVSGVREALEVAVVRLRRARRGGIVPFPCGNADLPSDRLDRDPRLLRHPLHVQLALRGVDDPAQVLFHQPHIRQFSGNGLEIVFPGNSPLDIFHEGNRTLDPSDDFPGRRGLRRGADPGRPAARPRRRPGGLRGS